MAGELLMSISQDEVERARFRSRRKFQTDMQSDFATAWDNGMKEGKAKGKIEGKIERNIEIARNALQMKMPVEDIMKLTGLTREEILSL